MAESSVRVSLDAKKLLAEAKFLVCGKPGVGKSSLINSVIGPGAEICDVFRHDDLERNINIWSSSGLQDGTVEELESAYLGKMYERCSNVDIVLYCMDINYLSWTTAEVKATELLIQKFGVDFWKKAILVLTKANRVMVPGTHKGRDAIYHKECYQTFVKKFCDQLIQQGVPEDVAVNLRAVAAGYCDPDDKTEKDRYIYYASDKIRNEKKKFDFLLELMATCLEIFKNVPREVFSTTHDQSGTQPDDETIVIDLQRGVDYAKQRMERAHLNTPLTAQSLAESVPVGLGGMAGAATGAVVGTMIAGPIGTVVGGATGFIVGSIRTYFF